MPQASQKNLLAVI